MINYVKSLGEIYQQSSDITTAFKHSGNTMEQVDQSSSIVLPAVGIKPYWLGRSSVGIEGRNQVLTTIFSVMRDRIGVTEIGLKSPQSDGCDTFGTGVTIAVRHTS